MKNSPLKGKTPCLTKRVLQRAANNAYRAVAENAMKTMGYVVAEQQG